VITGEMWATVGAQSEAVDVVAPRDAVCSVRLVVRVGLMGCQRTVLPFSREEEQTVGGVEIGQAQGEGAAAAAGGFGVQAEEECVEDDVVAAGTGGLETRAAAP
jgi:hypothetical protein